MSHQTGIHANAKLKEFFSTCKDGSVRVFKVGIDNEELQLIGFQPPMQSWDDDFDRLVLPFIDSSFPCYLFYRLDSKDELGFQWLLICWCPDSAPVREKMLFASTKATLKKEFGGGQIQNEMFGTQKGDISLKVYKQKFNEKQPLPYSTEEELLNQIRTSEIQHDVSLSSSKQTIQGVELPITDDVINALFDMRDNRLDYIQMSINTSQEQINLVQTGTDTEVSSLRSRIPRDHARYHLYRLPNSFGGDATKNTVFIYSSPGCSNCPVKERMMYSSCKSSLLAVIEKKIGLLLIKKIEIDDPDELTEEFLMNEIHPKLHVRNQQFARPRGPMNRGPRRLVKAPVEEASNASVDNSL